MDRGCHRRAPAPGFTLIEVVVALAVFAIGATGALLLITRLADATTELEMRTFAAWVAQNRIAEAELLGVASLPPGGSETMGARLWRWHQQLETGAGPRQSDRLVVVVEPESGGTAFEYAAPLRPKAD